MIVKKLTLRNFRNYGWLELEFDPKINVIVGENAQGKTNIVEAIYFLSLARSFRTQDNVDLIKDKGQFATIEARVEQDTTSKDIVSIITPNQKKIALNGKQVKKVSDLSTLVNVIVFEPKDSLMFSDSPLVRRNFLDISLSKKSPFYLENLIEYEKILKERNALLKEENPDLLQLDVLTEQLVEVSEKIVQYRSLYLNEINTVLTKVISIIKEPTDTAKIVYYPFVKYDNNFKENASRAYAINKESDLKKKVTQIGPHREDYKLILNGNDISTHGSQGENRLAVIALKLCPYFLIEEKDKKPILVLDDVLSELDKTHQAKLMNFLRKFEQVFITSTNLNVKNATIYTVQNHKVNRRNS